MSAFVITILTFVATTLLVICVGTLLYDRYFRYRVVRERVRGVESQSAAAGQANSLHLFKNEGGYHRHEDAELTLATRLAHLLDQAGFKWSVARLASVSLGLAVLGAGVALWIGAWPAIALPLLSAAGPTTLVFARRNYRRRQLCRQLPEAFEMISRAVRAGQTVQSALKIIADDFAPPISEEFALCYEQQNLGLSRETALRKLARRTNIMELQIFVVALLVQAKSGGNLVELLNNLAETIRKRLKLAERVRALTGEGRMQARVLIVLPFAALIGLFVLSPSYAAISLQWPWLLGITAAAQAAGAFWIRKIVNFEY